MQTDVRVRLRDLINEVKNTYSIEAERYDTTRGRWVENSSHLLRMKQAEERLLETIGEAFLNGLL